MKKQDIIFIILLSVLFCPFFVSNSVYDTYHEFNINHGFITSFIKFSILSTIGEIIGLRIISGKYIKSDFGYIPRAIVWGFLGIGIYSAMIIFSQGVPVLLGKIGIKGAASAMSGEISILKIFVAFSISVCMNTIFAPVFMTFHKITDFHIMKNKGKMRAFIHPINFGEAFRSINWYIQWGFVFKKTIPFFWFPAHTITFLLPANLQVLFAAFLGIILGVILSIAALRKSNS